MSPTATSTFHASSPTAALLVVPISPSRRRMLAVRHRDANVGDREFGEMSI
jgi:hypothetical protein